MAVDYGGEDRTFKAGEDLTDKQYRFVKMNTSSPTQPAYVVLADTAGERADGILQSEAATAGDLVRVRTHGTSKLAVHEAMDEGQEIDVTVTTGLGGKAGADDYVRAVALEAAGAQDDLIAVRLVDYQKNA